MPKLDERLIGNMRTLLRRLLAVLVFCIPLMIILSGSLGIIWLGFFIGYLVSFSVAGALGYLAFKDKLLGIWSGISLMNLLIFLIYPQVPKGYAMRVGDVWTYEYIPTDILYLKITAFSILAFLGIISVVWYSIRNNRFTWIKDIFLMLAALGTISLIFVIPDELMIVGFGPLLQKIALLIFEESLLGFLLGGIGFLIPLVAGILLYDRYHELKKIETCFAVNSIYFGASNYLIHLLLFMRILKPKFESLIYAYYLNIVLALLIFSGLCIYSFLTRRQ
jgi:hypothetical protein